MLLNKKYFYSYYRILMYSHTCWYTYKRAREIMLATRSSCASASFCQSIQKKDLQLLFVVIVLAAEMLILVG